MTNVEIISGLAARVCNGLLHVMAEHVNALRRMRAADAWQYMVDNYAEIITCDLSYQFYSAILRTPESGHEARLDGDAYTVSRWRRASCTNLARELAETTELPPADITDDAYDALVEWAEIIDDGDDDDADDLLRRIRAE